MNRNEFREAMGTIGDANREGANRLCAERINALWAERGANVNARVETLPVWNGRSYLPLAVIVSDTLNGMPRP